MMGSVKAPTPTVLGHCHWPGCLREFTTAKSSPSLRSCGRCSAARYCNLKCQHKHWDEHKRVCKDPDAESVKRVQEMYFGDMVVGIRERRVYKKLIQKAQKHNGGGLVYVLLGVECEESAYVPETRLDEPRWAWLRTLEQCQATKVASKPLPALALIIISVPYKVNFKDFKKKYILQNRNCSVLSEEDDRFGMYCQMSKVLGYEAKCKNLLRAPSCAVCQSELLAELQACASCACYLYCSKQCLDLHKEACPIQDEDDEEEGRESNTLLKELVRRNTLREYLRLMKQPPPECRTQTYDRLCLLAIKLLLQTAIELVRLAPRARNRDELLRDHPKEATFLLDQARAPALGLLEALDRGLLEQLLQRYIPSPLAPASPYELEAE